MTRSLTFVAALVLAAPTTGLAQRNARQGKTVLDMEVTAYCVDGETASGEQTRRGIVAADPDVLPLGSRIRVDGLGRKLSRTYAVEDTGRAVKGRQIDIFMPNCEAAKEFGRQTARVKVLRRGDASSRTGG